MKVSIITTIYKAEKDLPRLLDSMMAQKSEELEFFLIDNGSPDRCGEICQEYAKRDSRFKLYTIKDNIGYIRARNIGIKAVDADYIGFCDSDDYLVPEAYDRAIDKIYETDCDLYITAYQTVSGNETTQNKIPYSVGLYKDSNIEDNILPQAFGSLPDKPALHGFAWKQIFRRNIFIENALSYMTELQPYEDQILNVDFIKNSQSVYIDDNVLYNYIVNVESITAKLTSNFNPSDEWKRIQMFYLEKKKRITSDIQKEALSNQVLSFIYSMVLNSVKMKKSVKDVALELNSVIDKKTIESLVTESSTIHNMTTRFMVWAIKKKRYEFLVFSMRVGRKLRG